MGHVHRWQEPGPQWGSVSSAGLCSGFGFPCGAAQGLCRSVGAACHSRENPGRVWKLLRDSNLLGRGTGDPSPGEKLSSGTFGFWPWEVFSGDIVGVVYKFCVRNAYHSLPIQCQDLHFYHCCQYDRHIVIWVGAVVVSALLLTLRMLLCLIFLSWPLSLLFRTRLSGVPECL